MAQDNGSVIFDVLCSSSLPDQLRKKLKLAFVEKVKQMVKDEVREAWQSPSTKLPGSAEEMGLALKQTYIPQMESPYSTCEPAAAASEDYYCYGKDKVYCYHRFKIMNPDTGTVESVSVKHGDQCAVGDLVLTCVSPTDVSEVLAPGYTEPKTDVKSSVAST